MAGRGDPASYGLLSCDSGSFAGLLTLGGGGPKAT